MAIPIGLLGSEEALRNALAGSVSAAQTGLDISDRITQPFTTGGQQAFNLQAALSGAQGGGAQGRAFDQFQASPGQQFLRDEAEQALLRNASAIGGLGGGRVREALQEQAVGLASQDFGNQFDRLGQVSGLGGQFAARQAGSGLDIGRMLAGLTSQTGRDLSAGRTQAGRDISGNIGGATSALANLVSQQGAGLGDILGTGAGNLSNILSGAGQQQLASQTQLAQLLANLALGEGSQLGSLTGVGQVANTPGALGGIGDLLSGVSQFPFFRG